MTAASPAVPAGTLPERAVDDVVADVLAYEFALDAAHCLLGNMKYKIPPDQQLYVVVFDDMGPPFGVTAFLDQDEASPTFGQEVQQASVLHAVRVEVMGFLTDAGYDPAKAAANRLASALGGFYAQQLAGQYRMQVGRAQQPVNASDAEVTGRLVRYVARVNVTALHQTAKNPPGAGYFDKFNGATTDGTANPPEVQSQ